MENSRSAKEYIFLRHPFLTANPNFIDIFIDQG